MTALLELRENLKKIYSVYYTGDQVPAQLHRAEYHKR